MHRELVNYTAKQLTIFVVCASIIIGAFGGIIFTLMVRYDKAKQTQGKLEQELGKYQHLFAVCWDSDTKCTLSLQTCEKELQVMRDFIYDSEDGREFEKDEIIMEPTPNLKWQQEGCRSLE